MTSTRMPRVLVLLILAVSQAASNLISITPDLINGNELPQDVTFICEDDGKITLPSWVHNGEPFFYPDYEIDVDNPNSCSFTVPIENIDFNGMWRCSYFRPGGEAVVKEANLTIAIPPQQPVLLDSLGNPASEVNTEEFLPVSIDCVSEGGRPAAEISWHYGVGGEILGPLEETYCNFTDSIVETGDQIYTVTGNLNCTFGPEFNQRELICLGYHPFAVANTSSAVISVEFTPELFVLENPPLGYLSVDGDHNTFYAVPLNDDVELKILFQANDGPVKTTWESDSFGTLGDGDYNERFEAIPFQQYQEDEEGPSVDGRTDVYVAALRISKTNEKDFEKEYRFTFENQFCIAKGACPTITFGLDRGDRVKDAGLSGGAIAAIVIACVAVVIVILILVLARVKGILCFGGKRRLIRRMHREDRKGSPPKDPVPTSEPAARVPSSTDVREA